MEVVGHPALSTRLVLGHRAWAGEVEAVLAAIAKASYDVAADGSLTRVDPAELVMAEQVYNPSVDREDQVVRFESDLVPYKPKADLVVLGPAGGGASHWVESLSTGGDSLVRQSTDSWDSMASTRVTFGWQRSDLQPRLSHAGSDLGSFDPTTHTLPEDFSNLFYNAGTYVDQTPPYEVKEPPFEHLSPGQSVFSWLFRDPDDDGDWDELISVELEVPSVFPTAEIARRSSGQISLDMRLDTFVYERNADTLHLVWRGVYAYAPTDLADFEKLVFDWEAS